MFPSHVTLLLLPALLAIMATFVPVSVLSQSDSDVNGIRNATLDGEAVALSAGCTLTYYPSQTGYYGGSGGTPWSDQITSAPLCTQFPTHFFGYGTVSTIGQLSTTYVPGAVTFTHGTTTAGSEFDCPLAADGSEKVVSIVVYSPNPDGYVCGFFLTTNFGTECTIGGTSCKVAYRSNWVSGQYLSFLEGRAGGLVDALRFVTETSTQSADGQ